MWTAVLIAHVLPILQTTQAAPENAAMVEVVEGMDARLPCLGMKQGDPDQVSLVIWYHGQQLKPIYSFDKRHGSEPQHWSSRAATAGDSAAGAAGDPVESRASFSASASHLTLSGVRVADAGRYRCRVDFRGQPTSFTDVNLNVIVPPSQPVLSDSNSDRLRSALVTGSEGSDLRLSCKVDQGSPPPVLYWRLEGSGGRVKEQPPVSLRDTRGHINLQLTNLTRSDLSTNISCLASNNNRTPPAVVSITLDMFFRPSVVELSGADRSLSVGREYTFTCTSTGSRPPAQITWYMGGVPLSHSTHQTLESGSVSTLTLRPSLEHQGMTLTCRAANQHMPRTILHAAKVLSVKFAPKAVLQLSPILKPDDIREGNDVFFNCHVTSNPAPDRIVWLHEGNEVLAGRGSSGVGVVITGDSLVLQNITRSRTGNYQCQAFNTEGNAISNPVPLRVMHAPVCGRQQRWSYGASRGEAVDVLCAVEADPPPLHFTWLVNTSTTVRALSSEAVSDWPAGPLTSGARFVPLVEDDFGSLLCSATNAVGVQRTPCVYKILIAARPESLQRCAVANQTASSFDLTCRPGHDGGQPQTFQLLLFSRQHEPVYNISQPGQPRFTVTGLEPDTAYNVILMAVNSKGASPKIRITAATRPSKQQKRTGSVLGSVAHHQKSGDWTPILGVILGALLALTVCVVAVVFVVRSRLLAAKPSAAAAAAAADASSTAAAALDNKQLPPVSAGVGSSMEGGRSPNIEPDPNPDVVPARSGVCNMSEDRRMTVVRQGRPTELYSPTLLNHLAFSPVRQSTERGGVTSGPLSFPVQPTPLDLCGYDRESIV